jgi:hypothetical protein
MKHRLLGLLVLGLVASAVLVTGVSAATTVFATGMGAPESITQTASGNFFVPDANGQIWNISAAGVTSLAADLSATTSLRGGLILPSTFSGVSGKFLFVGVDNATGAAVAGTMNTSTFATSAYHSQANGVWTQPVLAASFGSLSGDVLVTNQGSNTTLGSVDYFTPGGTVGTLATFSAFPNVVPFGADVAGSSFGEVGGPSLIVSDAVGGGIYTVDTLGNVKLFTTIPLDATAGQTGLRQIAFAPKEWKKYGGDLFVSLRTRDIDVVNRDGVVIGKISGASPLLRPRGLLFTTIAGKPTLLFSNDTDGSILQAGPGDVVPVAS